MIEKLRISNYKSLGDDVTIELGRCNFLVGRNGSGKSNIVDAVRFVADAMKLGLEGAITKRHGIKSVRRWSSGRPLVLSIHLTIKTEEYHAQYGFSITGHKKYDYIVKGEHALIDYFKKREKVYYTLTDRKWEKNSTELKPDVSPLSLVLPILSGDSRFKPLVDYLKNIAVYNIYPDVLRVPQSYDPQKPMEEHGKNWFSILKDQPKDEWEEELTEALKSLTGEIDDVSVRQVTGYLVANFRHGTAGETKKARIFDATQESDGTLRTAGIISALLQKPYLNVIGIEEPELTVHPGAVKLLYDFIKSASRKSQIIVTTHSPELLDCISDEDELNNVYVVEKVNNSTLVRSIDKEQSDIVKKGLMTLGEVHRTQGLRWTQEELKFDEE
ncbi:MAG: AAA family ATPase [Bacteroidia bacterium]|jgi:AAA15 family ATPase/GTPase|nr:AAA family ATPase [Bacteroidia bacterium]